MKVIVVGPNLNDQSKGQFHVHLSGCHDLVKNARREPEYKNGWEIDVHSVRDVVEAVYSDFIFHNDKEPWTEFVSEIHFAPCVTLPMESTQTHFAAIERTSMSDGETLAGTQFTIDSLADALRGVIGDEAADSVSDKEWDDMLTAYLNGMVRGFTKQIESLKSDIN
jgi:hypothetical protein